jgi:GDP-L-fucose synthase
MSHSPNRNDAIYVAGHRGLVGSAVCRQLKKQGYSNIITRTHSELDLTSQDAVEAFFREEKPDSVFLCAAKVGGIYANKTFPADFITENICMQTNVLREACKTKLKRLIFLGSSCIYPRDCPQPIKEEYLLTGPLEWTNRPYAIAKISGIEMCNAYNKQHGTSFLAAMPTNLYGPGDNYHPQNSHVLPALIRRFHEAKENDAPAVTCWGTGNVYREFLYSDDLAEALLFLMKLPEDTFSSLISTTENDLPIINIGCGEDLTIRSLTEIIQNVIGYQGDILWDETMPDGTPRKLLDITTVQTLGWGPSTSLHEGIQNSYKDMLENKRFCPCAKG